MTDAPERIWAEVFKPDMNGNLHTIAGAIPISDASVQYVRADHALALVAEAYKVCAFEVSPSPNYGSEDQPQSHYTVDCVLEDRQLRILAKTPSDALADREADRKRVRDEALREAAQTCDNVFDSRAAASEEASAADECAREIRALSEGDKTC